MLSSLKQLNNIGYPLHSLGSQTKVTNKRLMLTVFCATVTEQPQLAAAAMKLICAAVCWFHRPTIDSTHRLLPDPWAKLHCLMR